MKVAGRYQCLAVFLLCALVLQGCQNRSSGAGAQVSACETVTEIEGEYSCIGECVMTDSTGERKVKPVSGETDSVQRYPGASDALYQVNIAGSDNFHEIEIGALAGNILRTATAAVTDGQFPVLEEYVFETDAVCKAQGFTKIVRNPNPEFFKSCVIHCRKAAP